MKTRKSGTLVLIISGHTDLAASVANKTILETLNERPKS